MGTLSSETQAGRSPPRRTCPASQSFLVTFRSPHRRVITSLPVPVSTSCYLPRKGALGAEHFAGWRLWSKRLIPISTYWVPVKLSSYWRLLSLKKKKFFFFFLSKPLFRLPQECSPVPGSTLYGSATFPPTVLSHDLVIFGNDHPELPLSFVSP